MQIEREPRGTETLSALQKNPSIMREVGKLILKENDPALLPLAIDFLTKSAELEIKRAHENLADENNAVVVDFNNELINSLEDLSSVLDDYSEWPYQSKIPWTLNCIDLIKTVKEFTTRYQKSIPDNGKVKK
jgi:hypothetical protein